MHLHLDLDLDLDRAERIDASWSYPQSRSFAELLIDAEEHRAYGSYLSACCGS